MKSKKDQDFQHLNETQVQAVLMTVAGKPGIEIAEALGVTPETVSRWKKIPAFQAAVNALLRDAADTTRQRLRALATKAVDLIENALEDPSIPIRYRIQAAFKLLEVLDPKADYAKIGTTNTEELEFMSLTENMF